MSENSRTNRHSTSIGDMLRHFFKVSFRHIKKSKSTTLINISGLAVSLACFLFIAFYLIDETSYDSMHPQAANIYRISQSFHNFGDGVEITEARIPGLWVVALKDMMPEIKRFTRFSRFGYPGTVRYEKRDLLNVEQQFFWVDSTYTDIFSLPMVAGDNPSTILLNPSQVIVNETMAKKYFGSEDPLGQILIYARDGMDIPLIVAGVMKNYPSNVHFHPDFLASNLALTPLWNRNGDINSSYTTGDDRVNSWRDTFTYSYIEVENGTNLEKVDKTMREVMKVHLGEDAKYVWPTIVKLADIHFWPGILVDLESPGDPIYLYLFGSIGTLILLIACINYMNMSTAKSLQRAKEVGLRKTLGIRRRYLIFQFLSESVIITTIAIVIALALMAVVLPLFNDLSSQTLTFQHILKGRVPILLIGLTLVVGILSGSYPAFYLSSFKPLDVLRGKLFQTEGGAERFRKSLVVFQFTITLLLVVGTIVIQRQLSFINKTKLSESKDQVIAVRLFGIVHPLKVKTFSEIIKRDAAVEGVASGTQVPRQDRFSWNDTRLKAPALSPTLHTMKKLEMDTGFPSLFDLEFVEGRNFSVLHPTDTGALLVNESAVRDLQITPEKAIGLILEDHFTHQKREVIGVVKDFSYTSLRNQIEPVIITGHPHNAEVMYIKLSGNDFPGIIRSLEKTWKQVFPATPFNHWFLDEEFDQIYKQEKSTGTLFSYFSMLAIFIGCLGLFGLASYTVEQKTKEIGIRKVLGATGLQILLLLTSRFVKLILISLLIGIPLAYYLMNSWVQRFAYQAELSWTVFAGPAILVLFITCLTVGLKSMHAALKDPIDSLRHE